MTKTKLEERIDIGPPPAEDAGQDRWVGRLLHEQLRSRFLVFPKTTWTFQGTHWVSSPGKEAALSIVQDELPPLIEAEIKKLGRGHMAAVKALTKVHDLCAGNRKPSEWARTWISRCARYEQDIVWDSNRHLLNFPNGTYDIRSGELRPHDPADFITVVAQNSFVTNAEAPLFLQTLDEIFPGKPDVVEWVLRYLGKGLFGSIQEQSMAWLLGEGANGKTTLLNAIWNAFGNGYVREAARDLIVRYPNKKQSRDEVHSLMGARLVTCREAPDGASIDEAMIKSLTSDPQITCRAVYQQYVTFANHMTLIVDTNHQPRFADYTHGNMRRHHVVPFRERFTGDQLDPNRMDKLREEGEGIVQILINAARRHQAAGNVLPKVPEIHDHTADVLKGDLGEWLDSIEVVVGAQDEGWVPGHILHEDFQNYLEAEWGTSDGMLPSRRQFYTMLSNRGFRSVKRSQGKGFFGFVGRIREGW